MDIYNKERKENYTKINPKNNSKNDYTSDLDQYYSSIMYEIWALPKWKKQVQFINNVIEKVKDPAVFLKMVSIKMETIESDRKDKFYYLIGLLLDKLEITRDNLKIIISYAGQSTLSYYWRIIIKKINLEDENIQKEILNYMTYCPNYLLKNFEEIKFKTGNIKELLKKMNIPYKNREYLSMKAKG